MAQLRLKPRANLSDAVTDAAGAVILGKGRPLRLTLAYVAARGHLLIEDIPGVGKTTLTHLLARLLGFELAGIQFRLRLATVGLPRRPDEGAPRRWPARVPGMPRPR